jgi:uncharacterized membrane protein
MEKTIDIKESLRFGWDTVKANIGFVIALSLVTLVLTGGTQIMSGYLKERIPFLSVIVFIIAIILEMGITLGLMKIAIMFADSEKGQIGDLFSCFRLLLRYIAATIIYSAIVMVGLLLLVFPGVIWGIKFFYYPYLIVDKDEGIIGSLRASSQITMGAKWDLLGLFLVLALINILGAACLLIGLFVTVPITMVATAIVYRSLLTQTESPEAQETGAPAA